MGHQQLYWSHPRKFGQGSCSRRRRIGSHHHGLTCKYGLSKCFLQYAKDEGVIKLD